MKAIEYLASLIAGQKMGSSLPVQVSELEMLKMFLEIEQTITAGRAALANAEPDTTQRDAELWRAYKARKDAVINAGMVSKVMRTGPTEYMKVQDTL